MSMLLYHGTTTENAASLLNAPFAKGGELWLANDPGIARSYGSCVLTVTVPASVKLDAYPLRSGCLEPMEFLYREPAEFLMYHEGPLYMRLLKEI